MKDLQEKIDKIIKFGISEEDRDDISDVSPESMILLLAHIKYLKEKNDKMTEGLEKIASGLITAGEAQEIAQRYLEESTLRNWRKK